ncbi:MAG: AraC family transcriptional regulator [Thermoanaerobaculia bacterium]
MSTDWSAGPSVRGAVLSDSGTFASRQPAQTGEVRSRWTAALGLAEYRFEPGTVLPDHGHPWASLNWTLAGTMTDRFGSRRREHRPGGLGFHPPALDHRVEVGGEGGRAFHLEIRTQWLERARVAAMEESFLPRCDGPLLGVLERLRTELWAWDGSSPLIAEGLALELLGLLQRSSRPRDGRRPAWIERAVERVGESRERVTPTELAAEVGDDPTRVARLFRRHVGESIGDYGLHARLRRAHLLVTSTDRTIADIAHELGFSDHAHLTRRFKRRFGVPPSRLRGPDRPL